LEDSCSGTLIGWEFPELIPEYWVWEQFFADVSRPASTVLGGTDLAPGEAAVVRDKAAQAIANAATARRAAPVVAQAEADAAEAIISARDDLKRQLPESSLRATILKVYQQASQREYRLPVMGKRTDIAGTTRCSVSVKGREYPHLIPETEAWRTYLLNYADAAEHISVGPNEYKEADLRGIQKSRLSLTDDDLRRFLTFARDQGAIIEQMQDAGVDEKAIAQSVSAARDTLLRTLHPDAWMKVRRDAEMTRRGITFTYPPSADASGK
jgi:hypothetical protein